MMLSVRPGAKGRIGELTPFIDDNKRV